LLGSSLFQGGMGLKLGDDDEEGSDEDLFGDNKKENKLKSENEANW